MPTSKRAPSRPMAGPATASAPLTTALLLSLAIAFGVGNLVSHGQMEWPPTHLLASLYTVAGCLALVGPILLLRKTPGEIGLGDFAWMVGGLVVWVFDLSAIVQGETRTLAWATPLSYQPMGLTILAVMVGGWRYRVTGSDWSWTNVVGWSLGIFWIALAAITLLPPRTLGLVLR